ncbi:hypothetical protein ABT282_15920 [Streptomyces sp. NPDC000927]|uniref:hypothetical protein n=1 Tax=Streptomyces sp. NPDC000927 TaxID=3154371 RepID=UPI003329E97D
MTYPYAQRMAELAEWYRRFLKSQPTGPIRTAHTLLLAEYDRMAKVSDQPGAPREAIASMVQWCRVVIVLAEAAREAGHPGWSDTWNTAWRDVCDSALGPYGPDGP